MPMAIKEKLN